MNKDSDYFLHALDDNLKHQLQNWFSVGFLDLRKIDWNSSASLLEKIIEYEGKSFLFLFFFFFFLLLFFLNKIIF